MLLGGSFGLEAELLWAPGPLVLRIGKPGTCWGGAAGFTLGSRRRLTSTTNLHRHRHEERNGLLRCDGMKVI
jgi:hypothetical protein